MAKAEIGSAEFYRRKNAIRKMVLDVVGLMDNHRKLNIKYYTDLFDNYFTDTPEGDAAFDKWAASMGHDVDDTITINHLPFEEIELKQIKDALKYLGVPLEQHIIYRHTGEPSVTSKPVIVGYCSIKKLQQIMSKKLRQTVDSKKNINIKTGQLTRSDDNRISDLSDAETIALMGFGMEHTLKELLGPRADNNVMRGEMLNKIHRDGFVQLGDMEERIEDKTMLNTLDIYLLGSGIRSDLVNNDLELLYTKRRKAEEANIKFKK